MLKIINIKSLKLIYEEIIELFISKQCIVCGVYNLTDLCNFCQKKLKEIEPESFVTRHKSPNWEIEEIYKKEIFIEKVFYFLEYNQILHEIITKIKYQNKKNYINKIMKIIFTLENFNNLNFSFIDYITYVPITENKMRERGFNQSKEIALILSKKINKPVLKILNKIKDTKNQAELNRKERLINLRNSFKINDQILLQLKTENILLVDDICTTGSTLIECSKTIKETYDQIKIFGFCLARGKINLTGK